MSSFGKWSQQGVPQKGWTCIGFEDLGEPATQCEMCESQDIRYVHQMQHADYPYILECGCVCAGKMEEDYAAASKRESDSKNLAQRRGRWLTRKWKVSQSGNHYLKTDGFHIVVFPKDSGWSGTITWLSTGVSTQARRLYDIPPVQLIDLVALYSRLPGDRRSYNRLIAKLRKRGSSITSVADKAKLDEMLHSFGSKDRAAYEAIEYAAECGLIRVSDSHKAFVDRRNEVLAKLAGDPVFAEFEELHLNGHRTKLQMLKEMAATNMIHISVEVLEQEYDDRLNDLKQKNFLDSLFSAELALGQVLAFYEYEDSEGEFSTMHKTKGTGIENVLLVVDEYGWTTEYDFKSCFSKESPQLRREIASRKLLYVASSRTKKNLVCVRLMKSQEEADQISAFFPEAIKL